MSENLAIAMISGALVLLGIGVSVMGWVLNGIINDLKSHKDEFRGTSNQFLILKTQFEDFVKLYTIQLAKMAHCPGDRFGLDREIDEFLFLIHQYNNPNYDLPDWSKLHESATALAIKCDHVLSGQSPQAAETDEKLKFIECLSETLKQLVVNLCEHKMARDRQLPPKNP